MDRQTAEPTHKGKKINDFQWLIKTVQDCFAGWKTVKLVVYRDELDAWKWNCLSFASFCLKSWCSRFWLLKRKFHRNGLWAVCSQPTVFTGGDRPEILLARFIMISIIFPNHVALVDLHITMLLYLSFYSTHKGSETLPSLFAKDIIDECRYLFLHPWKFTWKETKCLKIGNCTLWPLSILFSLVPQITMRPRMIRDGSYYCFLIAIASSARKFINLQTSSHHARHDACTSLFLIFFTETCLVFSSCLLLALKKILIFRGGNFTN